MENMIDIRANVSFLNSGEIEMLYKLFELTDHIQTNTKRSGELSMSGPKISAQIESVDKPFDVVDKLYAVWSHLQDNDYIDYERPNSIHKMSSDNLEFGFESVLAHKLYFPKSKLAEISNLEHLAIWVAEPDHSKLTGDRFRASGTFLYLIETSFDKAPYATTLSGCSALQVVSNLVSGKSFYMIDGNEVLGRYDSRHPIEKLESIGAIRIKKENIKSLYRKRYLTDEQSFSYSGKNYRCNDLLAYPLFIS